MSIATDVVKAWHTAVNDRDTEAALSCCHTDVIVGGPRGDGAGHDVMRAWLQRSGIGLEPQEELTEQGGRVVVRELAQWRTTENAPAAAPTQTPAETWVVFEVTDGVISAVRRYETPEDVPHP